MKKKERDTLLAAIYGAEEISKLCAKMKFSFTRLLEFIEDERSLEIIKELAEKTAEISSHCFTIAAIYKTVADGKSGLKSVEKTIDKMLDEIKEASDD